MFGARGDGGLVFRRGISNDGLGGGRCRIEGETYGDELLPPPRCEDVSIRFTTGCFLPIMSTKQRQQAPALVHAYR